MKKYAKYHCGRFMRRRKGKKPGPAHKTRFQRSRVCTSFISGLIYAHEMSQNTERFRSRS